MAKKKNIPTDDEDLEIPKGKVDEDGDEILDLSDWKDNLEEDLEYDLDKIKDDMLVDETEDESFGYEIDEVEDTNEIDIRSEFMNFAISAVTKDLDWYQKKIWKLYSEGGENIKARSCRSISRATGISRHEILRVVNDIKEKANKWYEQYERFI